MALYIPHSIFLLARLLYVRPENFGLYCVACVPVRLVMRSKVWVCYRQVAGIVGLNVSLSVSLSACLSTCLSACSSFRKHVAGRLTLKGFKLILNM